MALGRHGRKPNIASKELTASRRGKNSQFACEKACPAL